MNNKILSIASEPIAVVIRRKWFHVRLVKKEADKKTSFSCVMNNHRSSLSCTKSRKKPLDSPVIPRHALPPFLVETISTINDMTTIATSSRYSIRDVFKYNLVPLSSTQLMEESLLMMLLYSFAIRETQSPDEQALMKFFAIPSVFSQIPETRSYCVSHAHKTLTSAALIHELESGESGVSWKKALNKLRAEFSERVARIINLQKSVYQAMDHICGGTATAEDKLMLKKELEAVISENPRSKLTKQLKSHVMPFLEPGVTLSPNQIEKFRYYATKGIPLDGLEHVIQDHKAALRTFLSEHYQEIRSSLSSYEKLFRQPSLLFYTKSVQSYSKKMAASLEKD